MKFRWIGQRSPMPPRRMRIIHVAAQLATGGLERLLVEFARHADGDRFELLFVSLGERGSVAKELEAAGWGVETLMRPQGLCPSLVFRLAHLFRSWEADVIHAHNLRPLLYSVPAAQLVGAKVLHTRHGQQYGASQRVRSHFRVASGLVHKVVCVSEDGAVLSRAQGVPQRKLCTIHNGIDVSRFSYSGPQMRGPAVMVGRLSPEKDPQNLLRAAQLVVRQEPNFRLEIAGDGSCRQSLLELTKELGLQERVRFHGEIQAVAELLGRAAMFVLPSRTEGVSLTLLEAMARGLPVIATRVGGTPEVIEHNVNGLLAPARNAAELARLMLEVYRNPMRARAMGEAAHLRVAQDFDVRRMVADYQMLYTQCGRRGQVRSRAA